MGTKEIEPPVLSYTFAEGSINPSRKVEAGMQVSHLWILHSSQMLPDISDPAN